MKKKILYVCDICGKEHPTQEKAKKCEDFHEKDLEISSAIYKAGYCKGMPIEIRVENKERTKLATYKIDDVIERRIENGDIHKLA